MIPPVVAVVGQACDMSSSVGTRWVLSAIDSRRRDSFGRLQSHRFGPAPFRGIADIRMTENRLRWMARLLEICWLHGREVASPAEPGEATAAQQR